MRRARRNHLVNIRQVAAQIAALYEDAAKDLAAQAAKARDRSLTERWAAEYAAALKQRAAELRAGLYDVTYQGLKRSASLPTIANGEFWEAIGGQSFRDMFAVTPDSVLANLISGEIYKDNAGLSDRIWKAAGTFEKDIDYIVNRGIAAHQSTYDLAKALEQYVKPRAKRSWDWGKVYPDLAGKQVDYNAQRLARTAINHAYFLSNVKVCTENPFVTAMHWDLSNAHDERQVIPFGPDECDDYAAHDEGLGVGNWKPEEIPLPHPQCLCAQWAVIPQSLEEIGDEIGRWMAGEPNVRLDSWNALYGWNYDTQNDGAAGAATSPGSANFGNSRLQNNAGSGRMYSDNGTVYYPVTRQAIDNMPMPKVPGDSYFRALYHSACMDLLREVRESNTEAGTEFSSVFNMAMEQIGEYRRGFVGRVGIDDLDEMYHALHNHGSDRTLSYSDIVRFVNRENQISIGAVGNRGSYYGLFMTIDGDKDAYSNYLRKKGKETIYSANGVSFSLNTVEQIAFGNGEMPDLSNAQRKELEQAIVKSTEEILKASEAYGIQYIETSPLVAN